MEKIILECRKCKHEMNIKSVEELERARQSLSPPKCEKCGGGTELKFKKIEEGEVDFLAVDGEIRRLMFPVLRPVHDEVVLEFTAMAGEPYLSWDLKSEKRVNVVDQSPPSEDDFNKHQFALSPIAPNEIDLFFLDVKLITSPGENANGFVPEDWLSRVKFGYGFGPRVWVKAPLYAWESRVMNSSILFNGISSFGRALSQLDKFAKKYPGLVRGVMHDFREYLRRESNRHDAAMKTFIDSPRDKLSILTKIWYTKRLTGHQSRSRHWLSGEDLHLYIEPEEVPLADVRFSVILWGMGYHEVF